MKIDPSTATKVLADLVREDRAEARIWRARLENLSYSAVLASFAISAFFIGKFTQLGVGQLRFIAVLADGGLIAVTTILFFRIRSDLIELRKGQRHRQNLLNAFFVEEGQTQEMDLFLDASKLKPAITNTDKLKPAITDTDLNWFVALSIGVMLVKMIVVAVFATDFLAATQAR